MDQQRFDNLLKEFSLVLQSQDAPILKRLNDGIPPEQVKTTFEHRWFPEEVFQLYNWHDGTDLEEDAVIGELWMFKAGAFMSSSRAMQCYKRRAGEDDYWDAYKFPLFESRGGEYYLIDNKKNSTTAGMIFWHSIGAVDFDTIISKYDSLGTLFETILRCFQQGAYSYNKTTRILEFDFDLERRITRELNPGSAYWKIV
ncbi:MAG: hypothetical protein J0H74_30320 [Chitinophagaceae bacterium]|nr:hypothetical protein [Chitinophagaceae bacterium]